MALEKILMPKLGESVTEGTISTWLVKHGDHVNKYDPLAEVQTDKVVAEIPSSFTGVVKELIAKEGETLLVDALICYIETEEAKFNVDNDQADQFVHNALQETVALSPVESELPNKHRYSPAVLKMSQDLQIDLDKIKGTGKGGRITRKDLQGMIDSNAINNSKPVQKSIFGLSREGDIEIPVTSVRKTIAEKMLQSKHEIPHAWTMVEADVTNLVSYRDRVKNDFVKKEGFKLTYFAFFVKAVAQALREYPMMNSVWAGDKIIQRKDINISIAVATDNALYVPVIKHADEKTIKGIAREISELAQKSRLGKLTQSDMQGGTFTVNNTGVFGSIQSMGIINFPQAAILQVESIVKRPVVKSRNMIAICDMVNLCLSLDHRVLDGLICGQFIARVKEILEDISLETTSIY